MIASLIAKITTIERAVPLAQSVIFYSLHSSDIPAFVYEIPEPRHDKICLREFPTRPDTNRHAQPQKLARVLKFLL